jgi:hypothetical protein
MALLDTRGRTVTEADLSYYYEQVEILWLGGFGTTFAQIVDHLPATERHIPRLTEGLATLVDRNWLKLHDIPVSGSSDEGCERRCYVPIRKPVSPTTVAL